MLQHVVDSSLRSVLLAAADSAAAQKFVRRYGMRFGARRFVAGESAEELLDAARGANAEGFAVAAGVLGEDTQTSQDAASATRQYEDLLERFALDEIDANVALKITHLGLNVDPALALRNLSAVASRAARLGNFMRLDMEQSRYVDATLGAYRELRRTLPNVGCALQSYLYRSFEDLRSLLPLDPNIRLVKGAYLEPPDIAYKEKREVDENYVRMAELALSGRGYTAIATHDRRIIEHLIGFAAQLGLPKRGRFEFQMLYGVATGYAGSVVARGYRLRLAIPFGDSWYPYLMRRLAERPANLVFFLKGAFGSGKTLAGTGPSQD